MMVGDVIKFNDFKLIVIRVGNTHFEIFYWHHTLQTGKTGTLTLDWYKRNVY